MLEHIEKEGSVISQSDRARKLDEFKQLRERVAKLTRKGELTQDEFDSYMDKLDEESICKYELGIKDVVSLCSNSLFKCDFRSQDKYHLGNSYRFECKRKKMLKLKSLL